jgi:hypothetical protein
MTLMRLLATILLMCTASAFAQQKAASTDPASAEAGKTVNPASAEQNPLDRIQFDQFKTDRNALPLAARVANDPIALNLFSQFEDDHVCYAIRSYVVARDSKNSDSVHPVSSTTCVPVKRYGLKNAKVPTEPNAVIVP